MARALPNQSAMTQGTLPTRASRAATVPPSSLVAPVLAEPIRRASFLEKLVWLCWILVLFEPQWFVAKFGFLPAVKLPGVVFALVGIIAFSKKRPGIWLVPFATFIAIGVVGGFFADDRQLALQGVKLLMFSYVTAMSAMVAARNYRAVVPLLLIIALQFLWWGVMGVKSGMVQWDPTYANSDGFGPAMVIGVGLCFYFAMAWKNKKMKLLLYLVSGLCVASVISSFARGAFLALCMVLLLAWLRSPRKGRTTGAAVVAIIVAIAVAPLFTAKTRDRMALDNFWAEMATSFNGTSDATGNDRSILWQAGWKVWQLRPIQGVGPDNFGVAAARHFSSADVGGDYSENPLKMYERKLHNNYVEILAEFGVLGVFAYGWMLYDFWKKNKALRTKAFQERFGALSGGAVDLRMISLGLESGMLGYLGTGFFYDQLFEAHAFCFYALSCILFAVAKPQIEDAAAKRLKRQRVA